LFNPTLKEYGDDKIVYATSLGFRIVFIFIAVFILISVLLASEGPVITRFNGISVAIILICSIAALYLERWSFDKKTNAFERNVGFLFFYSRKNIPLDSLEKVVLYEPGVAQPEPSKYSRLVTRKSALVCVVDTGGNVYKLDMMKGGSITQARKIAESLSIFCDIPFNDETSISSNTLR
jgi:hypothetical protein